MARTPARRSEPNTAPVFEICVHGQPVSAQTARRPALQAWKSRVREACQRAWEREAPLEEHVVLRITHYCASPIGDVDNLAKPIQDSLQGVIYRNDAQVRDVTANRRNINGSFVVRYMSMPLALAFSDGRQFVHIRVWRSASKEDLG